MSMVSLVEEQKEDSTEAVQTFRIVSGQPAGQSYALEIASKYGIGFEQLKKLFSERGKLQRELSG